MAIRKVAKKNKQVSKNICTTQKSNSHYAPQPYTNQSVFKSLLNCTSEISHNATGRITSSESKGQKSPVESKDKVSVRDLKLKYFCLNIVIF